MKTTVWLWPVVTLMCASPFVCVFAQQEFQSYADFPSDSSLIQDYLAERNKRTKPSLSIVNPIDVLRQRLLLEIARRQMKENTRQVEINRAILKNIGKRGVHQHPYNQDKTLPLTAPMALQNNHHLQTNPNKIFDFLRRQDDIEKNEKDNMDINLSDNEINNSGDDDFQIRYLYRLHKNRYSKK